jgi:ketosteroid isomerase-like protein
VAGERVEWVRQQVEIWNSGDIDAFMKSVSPDFEFTPDPSFPDAGTYRGEEVETWIREWARTWQDNRLEVLGIEERGRAVLIESRSTATTSSPLGWPLSSTAPRRSKQPRRALADSPVNRCMLFESGLGCLKKPT